MIVAVSAADAVLRVLALLVALALLAAVLTIARRAGRAGSRLRSELEAVRCTSVLDGVRCTRPIGHAGIHAAGEELGPAGASYWGDFYAPAALRDEDVRP